MARGGEIESFKSKIAVHPENSHLYYLLITVVYYFDVFRLKISNAAAVNQRKARQKPVDRNAGPPPSIIGHGFNEIAAEAVIVCVGASCLSHGNCIIL